MSSSTDHMNGPIPSDRAIGAVPGLGSLTARQRALVRILAIADRRSMDPGPLVLALSQEFPGRYGEQLKILASRLIDGKHVLDAVADFPGVLDNSHVVALRLADQTGKLTEMYNAILSTPIAGVDDGVNSVGFGSESLRLSVMTMITWFLLTFLAIWIIPTFEAMFAEFGIEMPRIVTLLISFSQYLPIVAVFMLMLLMLYLFWNGSMAIHWFSNRFIPSRFGKSWRPATVRVRSLLAMIPTLGLSMEQGLTIIAHSHCGYATQRRFGKALAQIQQQHNEWTSLAGAGLITRREATALDTAKTGAAQAWMLNRFSQRRLYRITDRRFAHEVIFSLLNTAFFGLVIGWTAIAMFLMMSELIGSLA